MDLCLNLHGLRREASLMRLEKGTYYTRMHLSMDITNPTMISMFLSKSKGSQFLDTKLDLSPYEMLIRQLFLTNYFFLNKENVVQIQDIMPLADHLEPELGPQLF